MPQRGIICKTSGQKKKEAYFKKRQFKLLRAYAKGKLKKAERLRAELLAANVNFLNKQGFK